MDILDQEGTLIFLKLGCLINQTVWNIYIPLGS